MNPVGILGNMMYLEGRMLQKQYAVDADNCDEHTCQESRMHYMNAEQDGRLKGVVRETYPIVAIVRLPTDAKYRALQATTTRTNE